MNIPQSQPQGPVIRAQMPQQSFVQQTSMPPAGVQQVVQRPTHLNFSTAASPFHQTEYGNPQMSHPNFPTDTRNTWTGANPGIVPGSVPEPSQTPPGQPRTPQTPQTPDPATSAATSKKNYSMKLESDEPLGENATIAMVLYSNKNRPDLKDQYPAWPERLKQIMKIWKNLPQDERIPYVTQARENRTANRVNKTVSLKLFHSIHLHDFFSLYLGVGSSIDVRSRTHFSVFKGINVLMMTITW